VCTRELCTFRDSLARLNELKAQVVGISVTTHSLIRDSLKRISNFRLLSDCNREVTRLYDVELKDFAGLKGYSVAKPSVFISDKNGVLRYRWVSEDPGKEPNYEEVKNLLKNPDQN